jgi:hypothetical protein
MSDLRRLPRHIEPIKGHAPNPAVLKPGFYRPLGQMATRTARGMTINQSLAARQGNSPGFASHQLYFEKATLIAALNKTPRKRIECLFNRPGQNILNARRAEEVSR